MLKIKAKNFLGVNDNISLYDLSAKCAAEKSLHEFLKQAWSHIEGKVPFIDNWHIEAICEHLEACYRREIKNLLICVPPRSSKTTTISILFPIWTWLQDPSLKFLCASYGQDLSRDHSLKCRNLIESNWFQRNWGHKFKLALDQNTKSYFINDKKGYRMATSVNGANTGRGGNFLIIDDPHNVKEAESEIKRNGVIKWWTQSWSSRLNNPSQDVKIVVLQRVHENDLAGFIIANDDKNEWVKLILPMEFESERRSKTIILSSSAPDLWQDPRQKEGALLFPERFGVDVIKYYRKTLGNYAYAGQYQQRPAPLEGGIIKRNWFKMFNETHLPSHTLALQSWDTAFSDSPNAAYSACTTWLVFEKNGVNNILLLSCWRGQVGYPELRERAVRLFKNFADIGNIPKTTRGLSINKCIIEKKATGDPLIRDLQNSGINPIPYLPKGDKNSRVQIVSPYIEAGIVHLLDSPENRLFLDEMAKFPNASSRDYVDTLSQVLGFLRDNNMLTIPKDPELFVTKTSYDLPYFKR